MNLCIVPNPNSFRAYPLLKVSEWMVQWYPKVQKMCQKIDQYPKGYLWFVSFENISVPEVFADYLIYFSQKNTLCTHSNHWAIWSNDEMCLMVYRIKWPRSSSHRCNVYDIYIHIYIYIYYLYINIIYIWFIYMYCIVLYTYIYINKPSFWC